MPIFNRLRSGSWMISDVRSVIRSGLIGGGNSFAEIDAIMIECVDSHPLAESAPAALKITAAYLYGLLPDKDGAV